MQEQDYAKACFCCEELLLHNPHNHLYHQRVADIRYTMGGYVCLLPVLRIRNVYPGSRIQDLRSRISGPGSQVQNLRSRIKQQKLRRVKSVVVLRYFFVGMNFTKLKIILFLNMYKKFLAKLLKIKNF
jgi:hypothetical protein